MGSEICLRMVRGLRASWSSGWWRSRYRFLSAADGAASCVAADAELGSVETVSKSCVCEGDVDGVILSSDDALAPPDKPASPINPASLKNTKTSQSEIYAYPMDISARKRKYIFVISNEIDWSSRVYFKHHKAIIELILELKAVFKHLFQSVYRT